MFVLTSILFSISILLYRLWSGRRIKYIFVIPMLCTHISNAIHIQIYTYFKSHV